MASWADTGRRALPSRVERLQDLRSVAACLRDRRPVPPLLARWLVNAIEEFDTLLADGGRPNLHRLLDLPDRSPRQGRRRLVKRERDRSLRAVAAAIPGGLSTWARAEAVARLLADTSAEGPAETRGELTALRCGVYGPVPRHVRSLHRILARSD